MYSYIYSMDNKYKNNLMLEARSYSHTTYRERYGQTGKMHILDNASFEEDTHCFIAVGICGTVFQTYYKHKALDVNIDQVTCSKCLKKAQ